MEGYLDYRTCSGAFLLVTISLHIPGISSGGARFSSGGAGITSGGAGITSGGIYEITSGGIYDSPSRQLHREGNQSRQNNLQRHDQGIKGGCVITRGSLRLSKKPFP